MKRIIISFLLFTGFIMVRAQQEPAAPTLPSLNYSVLERKLEKSNEDIEHDRKKTKAKTWLKRGELLQDIHDVNTEFVRLGMDAAEAQLLMGEPLEKKTNDEGQELHVYERITLIYENDMLVDWEETQQILKNPLPLAIEAYREAYRLDDRDRYTDDIRENLDRLKRQAEEDAVLHFNRNDYEKALEDFELVLQASENPVYENYIDSVVIFNAGLAARSAGLHEKSAEYFKRATEIGYGSSDSYYFLSREYATLGDTAKAVSALKKGYQNYPDSLSILTELVNHYLASGNSEEGMKYLEITEEKMPNDPSIHFAKGTLYEKMGDTDKALEAYEKSIEVGPEYYNSWFNLGALHYNIAVELYDIANTKENVEEYNEAKAIADEELKKAIEPMEKAHSLRPNDPAPLETLKTIYYRLGMEEEYQEVTRKLESM